MQRIKKSDVKNIDFKSDETNVIDENNELLDGISVVVSVIIPTYKRGLEFLSRSVGSVLKQTYKNTELIVIDDSPIDYENRQAIEKYMHDIIAKDSRVRYLQNAKSMGGSLARNRGIEVASGEYITFLDDDDEYKPLKIEKQINFMLKNNFDLSFSNMVMHNDTGKVVDMREYKDITSFDNDSLLHYHLTHIISGTPTFMFKAEKLREIGGFKDVKMGQDFYLMLNSIESGMKIGYLNDCDVIVYKHKEEAISNGKTKIIGENNLYIFKRKYFQILNNQEIKYIKFRHYVVMAVAYKRNTLYPNMMLAFIQAFIISPMNFFKQAGELGYKVLANRNM